MKAITQKRIEEILHSCVSRALMRLKTNVTYRPFHEALLTKELVLASSFERSFSTSFGQGPIEEISAIMAADNGYEVARQKEVYVNVRKGVIDEIERICSSLRSGERKPNWKKEIEKLHGYSKGDYEARRVISDLWMKKDGVESFISIKTVKPNLDQTEIAKKSLMLLKAHNPEYETFFALYYNPGGESRSDYNWYVPLKIFDLHNDECVLIGRDYWDKLGGENAYNELLMVFSKVGKITRQEILSM